MGGVLYSRDWSISSCLRTLVWLVSLISPARNISSTTVYTWREGRAREQRKRAKRNKKRVGCGESRKRTYH